MSIYTACSTSGASNSAFGTGRGTLVPGSTVTVTGITPPATLGTLFAVSVPYPNINLSSEADSAISVAVNTSRNDAFWRIDETPAVGSIPAGEPATSFVERCGSTGTNNGRSRNIGLNNNFSLTIYAQSTPVGLQEFHVE